LASLSHFTGIYDRLAILTLPVSGEHASANRVPDKQSVDCKTSDAWNIIKVSSIVFFILNNFIARISGDLIYMKVRFHAQ